jgi:sec-independent protein translocase protein TatA
MLLYAATNKEDLRMFGLQAPELLIILVIVIVLFGASRFADLGGSLGRGIREFRRGVRDEDKDPSAINDPSAPKGPPTTKG